MKPSNNSSPESEPNLREISRSGPSLEAHHPSHGPDTGSNSGRRQITKKIVHGTVPVTLTT